MFVCVEGGWGNEMAESMNKDEETPSFPGMVLLFLQTFVFV